MPIYRRRRFRRKFRRSRGRFRRFARRVYRAINYKAEKKMITTSQSTFADIPIGGIYYDVTQIGQGTGKGQRVGNKVRMRYFKLKMDIWSGTTVATGYVHWAVVMPRTAGLGISDTPINFSTELWDTDKFHVVYDKMYEIDTSISEGNHYIVDKVFKLPHEIIFNDNNLPAVTGQVWLWIRSNDNATPYPQLMFSSVTTFTDV